MTNDEVSIVLEDNVTLDPDTPPLKTFFVDRIIGEMKKKDIEQVESGVIKKDDTLDPIKPPPSSGRKLSPGSSNKDKRVQPAKTTRTQPKILIPNRPV